jgi:hypothetical protein
MPVILTTWEDASSRGSWFKVIPGKQFEEMHIKTKKLKELKIIPKRNKVGRITLLDFKTLTIEVEHQIETLCTIGRHMAYIYSSSNLGG